MKRNLPFDFKRWPAIDGKEADLDELYDEGFLISNTLRGVTMGPQNPKQFTPGALGCYMSHVGLWEYCVKLNKPIIILEDDIKIVGKVDDFYKNINNFVKYVPEDWDIIYLAYHNRKNNDVIDVNINVCKMKGGINGTHGYIIKPHAAQVLLNGARPIKMQVDKYMNTQYDKLKVYGNKNSTKFFVEI
jgi:glycosyl transferase family 25